MHISKMRTEAVSDDKLPSPPRMPQNEVAAVHTLFGAVLCTFATRVLSPCISSAVGHEGRLVPEERAVARPPAAASQTLAGATFCCSFNHVGLPGTGDWQPWANSATSQSRMIRWRVFFVCAIRKIATPNLLHRNPIGANLR